MQGYAGCQGSLTSGAAPGFPRQGLGRSFRTFVPAELPLSGSQVLGQGTGRYLPLTHLEKSKNFFQDFSEDCAQKKSTEILTKPLTTTGFRGDRPVPPQVGPR